MAQHSQVAGLRRHEMLVKPTIEWTDAQAKVLLDIYEKERPKFVTRGLVCRKLWAEVARKVNNATGHHFKGSHCENKWKVLMRGYRRARRDKAKGQLSPDSFKRIHPLHDRVHSILEQEVPQEICVSAKDAHVLAREERQVWSIADSRRLLTHYARLRLRFQTTAGGGLPQGCWAEVADCIRAENPHFKMTASHCYSRFRFLRTKYQRAMMLCSDDASRSASCPLFTELYLALSQDPLPEQVPLTPTMVSQKKKAEHGQPGNKDVGAENSTEAAGAELGLNLPSVVHVESVHSAHGEFAAYLATLIDGLAAGPLRDRAMQDILQYIFTYRRNVRLAAKATVSH